MYNKDIYIKYYNLLSIWIQLNKKYINNDLKLLKKKYNKNIQNLS